MSPAPSILVTFLDADGDEFPVRLWGMRDQFTDEALERSAKHELLRLANEDQRWNPTMPVKVGKVEYWNELPEDDTP
jgi:hypothetical protein